MKTINTSLYKEYISSMNILLENEQYRTSVMCAEVGLALLEKKYVEIQLAAKKPDKKSRFQSKDFSYSKELLKKLRDRVKNALKATLGAEKISSQMLENNFNLVNDINKFSHLVKKLKKRLDQKWTWQLLLGRLLGKNKK